MDRDTVIKNYLTPSHPTAFGGIQKVYQFYKGKIGLNEVKKILSNLDAYTLHKEYKQLTTNPNYVNHARQQFQADIAYVDHLTRYNDGFKYLLVCIDSFTKFAFVRPLKDKTGMTTLNAFQSILKQANQKPKILLVDKGTEFLNQAFLNFCRQSGIKLINNYTSIHAPIAERFIRTLKRIMVTYMTAKNTNRYIDVLQSLVKTYNLRKHRSIKMPPFEAEKPSSGLRVRESLSKMRQKIKKRPPKLQIGQKVRIALERKVFTRGHHIKSSKEIFTIYHIKTKLPIPIYYIKDKNNERISGGFYGYELTPVYM